MADRQQSIDNLQKALSMELTAIHQYLLHAHVLDDWGLDMLAARMREEMQEELGHASRFIERILFLDATPEVSAAKAPRRAEDLQTLFESDLREEQGAIEFYTEAARAATEDADIGTRTLFETILLDEEGHMDWLALQISLLKRMGEPAYIAKHMTVASGNNG